MIRLIVCADYDEVSSEAFKVMRETALLKHPVLGLATGSSPIGLYKKMIADHKSSGTSWAHAVTYNLDEYVGLGSEDEQSYYWFMRENLFDSLDIPEENTHIPDGMAEDPEAEAAAYEDMLARTQVDLQILGIGSDGHIGFNEPGTPFDSLTHVTDLAPSTIRDNARFFQGDTSRVPTKAITQGLGTIMRAKRILLLADGANKADAVKAMLKGEVTVDCPASILQRHPDVTVIIDRAAAGRIS